MRSISPTGIAAALLLQALLVLADDTITEVISPIASFQYLDDLDSQALTFGGAMSPVVSFQYPDDLNSEALSYGGMMSPLISYGYGVNLKGPDLMIESVSFSPSSVSVGGTFSVQFRIRNIGNASTDVAQARIRISPDSLLTMNDPGLSPLDVEIPALAAYGGSHDAEPTVTVPAGTAPGLYYVGIFADPLRNSGQVNEANDAGLSSARLTVIGVGPPALLVTPATRSFGSGNGTTSFTIANLGGGTLNWTALTVSSPWVHITGPSSGTAGLTTSTLTVSYEENPSTTERTGTIQITAPAATPVELEITVVQHGAVPANTATHLEFSAIDSSQNVSVPFYVTVTARDGNEVATGFSGEVLLTCNSNAKVDPTKALVKSGTWSGWITLDQPFSGTVLKGSSSDLSGQSNPFDVGQGIGQVVGTVVYRGLPVDGIALIELRFCNGKTYSEYLTDSTGTYRFRDVPAGNYLIRGTYVVEGVTLFSEEEKIAVLPSPAVTTTKDGYLRIRTKRRPVLLVPGIMGSTIGNGFAVDYPQLPPTSPADAQALRLYDPYRKVGWFKLEQWLGRDSEVFEVPWDWRISALKPAENQAPPPCASALTDYCPAWQVYLKPKIDEAKRVTGHTRVDVVAHSLGGLMTRAYIQSPRYTNDIDRLVMVGTPSQGGPMTYYIWDGGNPNAADAYSNFSLVSIFLPDFYSQTLAHLHRSMKGDSIDIKNQTAIQKFLRSYVPTVGELRPTYPFLIKANDSQPVTLLHANSPLINLNQDLARYTKDNSSDPTKVQTALFLSNSEDTLRSIEVGSPGANGLYPEGQPKGKPNKDSNFGDGTVANSSAAPESIVKDRMVTLQQAKGPHSGLIGTFAYEIDAFLAKDRQSEPLYAAAPPTLAASASTGARDLLVSVLGRVEPELLDPLGRFTGISLAPNDLSRGIPDSTMSVNQYGSNIQISGAEGGAWDLTVNGVPGDAVRIAITASDELGFNSKEQTWLLSGRSVHLQFSLDWSATEMVVVHPPAEPPTGLRAQNAGDVTRLMWQPPQSGAASYKVYAKRDDQPQFGFLTTTTATEITTTRPWNTDGSGERWLFIVLSVSNDGQESYFTTVVENQIRVLADFSVSTQSGDAPLAVSFKDQSTGEITSWAWDFDGDGEVDSTEQNPTVVYGADGSYTVTLTVVGPHGTDTRIAVGQINVGTTSVPVILDSDGDAMSDDWEQANGLNPNDPSDAALDSDGDGFTNLQEYIAGTDPLDAAEALAITLIQVDGDNLHLGFQTISGRVYSLQSSDSPNGTWAPVGGLITGDGALQVVLDPGAAQLTRFYRVVVVSQP